MLTLTSVFSDIAASCVLLGQGNRNPNQNTNITWLALPIIIVLFYLLLMRPEKRKRQELERQLQNLKQNDQIVTYGGIFGTVVNANKDSEWIVIRVDENNNTRLRILRSAIMKIEGEEKGKDVVKEK